MSTGVISAGVWDELFQPDSLGSRHSTTVIARVVVAQILQMKDTLASQTLIEYFKTNSTPKKTKMSAANAKEWFDLIYRNNVLSCNQDHLWMRDLT